MGEVKRLGVVMVALGLILAQGMISPAKAQEERSGAFYFGDSGAGNGTIDPPDLTTIQQELLGLAANYSGCQPPSRDIQDVDADVVLSPTDYSKVQSWVLGNYLDPIGTGKPFRIEIGTLTPTVNAGDSVILQARAWDDPSTGDFTETLRPGWGVIFEVLPTSQCPTARIYGRDPTPTGGEGKDQFVTEAKVYEYTQTYAANGWASVKLWALGCSAGQTIHLRVYIPGDAESLSPGGRFPNPLEATQNIVATVTGDPVTCNSIAIDQADPTTIVEGATQTFTATCAMSDGSTQDCTLAASWSSSGDVTNLANLVTANQIPCGAGGSGSVTATLASCANPSATNAITVQNDDTVVSTLITPPLVDLEGGEQQPFTLTRTFSDSCSENLTNGAGWHVQNSTCSPPGTISANGLYTAPVASGNCAEEVDTNSPPADSPAQVNVLCTTCLPPCIATVFPLDFASRFKNNAHLDQHLTVVMDLATPGCGAPTAVSGTCGSVSLNCTQSSPGDPDWICVPTPLFTERTTYTCNLTASNPWGNDTASGAMTTALAAADPTGGMAGGYIGGLDYDSAVGHVGPGSVTLRAIDAPTSTTLLAKSYVQIIQGATLREYFIPESGTLNVTLDPLPINELTLGYKCGAVECPKREQGATLAQYRTGQYRNYQYQTFYNLDASELNLVLPLMSSAETGRYKARITGTLPIDNFATYIAPRPSIRLRPMFAPPVKIRVGLVVPPGKSIGASASFESLLAMPDYQVSVSICVSSQGWPPLAAWIKAALPANLILPELRRQDYTQPCASWTSNESVVSWEAWSFTPGETRMIWSVGAYANGTSFSLTGGFDLFSFPLTVCALGVRPVAIPAGLQSGDTFVSVGTNAAWTYDLRESWTNPSGSPGFDPDPGINRRVLMSVTPRLPIDPARRDATLRGGVLYRVPNFSDAYLWPEGDATWDDRFYRKNVAFITGADFGAQYGFGVTGLGLTGRIDECAFTVFAVGYMQSVAPKLGNRDLNYWLGSITNSKVVSLEHAGANSTWSAPAGMPGNFWVAREDGGPTNYSCVVALTRPAAIAEVSIGVNPGFALVVSFTGPVQKTGNEAITVTDFLNLPEAVAPNPDDYLYPGPQWADTQNQWAPINRNGELLRVKTVTAADAIPTDTADPWNRLYFEFTRPTMMNTPSRAVHTWSVSLRESELMTVGQRASAKFSAKAKVMSTTGGTDEAGGHRLYDAHAHFLSQGVAPNDTLQINSRRYGVLYRDVNIVAVEGETQLLVNDTWGQPGTLPGNATNVRYKVRRKDFHSRGLCQIDEWFGGGPEAYNCLSNTFWKAQGPVIGTSNIRVHVPNVTPGATTLHGTTGVIPSLWEGTNVTGTQLEWSFSLSVYSTHSYNQGGLWPSAPYAFDWNNQKWRVSENALEFSSGDSAFCLYQ